MTTEEKTQRCLHHAERLLAAMGGSPEGWSFTGDVVEGDPEKSRCACGHPIRWEFQWKHEDGRTLVTGSVCVENLPLIDRMIVEAMRAALVKAIQVREEAARKARAASLDAEVDALRTELRGLIEEKFGWAIRSAEAIGSAWIPHDVYSALRTSEYYRCELRRSRTLKTPRGQAECIRSAIRAFRTRFQGDGA